MLVLSIIISYCSKYRRYIDISCYRFSWLSLTIKSIKICQNSIFDWIDSDVFTAVVGRSSSLLPLQSISSLALFPFFSILVILAQQMILSADNYRKQSTASSKFLIHTAYAPPSNCFGKVENQSYPVCLQPCVYNSSLAFMGEAALVEQVHVPTSESKNSTLLGLVNPLGKDPLSSILSRVIEINDDFDTQKALNFICKVPLQCLFLSPLILLCSI